MLLHRIQQQHTKAQTMDNRFDFSEKEFHAADKNFLDLGHCWWQCQNPNQNLWEAFVVFLNSHKMSIFIYFDDEPTNSKDIIKGNLNHWWTFKNHVEERYINQWLIAGCWFISNICLADKEIETVLEKIHKNRYDEASFILKSKIATYFMYSHFDNSDWFFYSDRGTEPHKPTISLSRAEL
jgi:hypothetical protein